MHWYKGSLIAVKRKEKGWTQMYVSTQSGLRRNQIMEMVKGHFTGGIKQLRKYLDLLRLKIAIIEEQNDLPQFDELSSLFEEGE